MLPLFNRAHHTSNITSNFSIAGQGGPEETATLEVFDIKGPANLFSRRQLPGKATQQTREIEQKYANQSQP